MLRLPPFSFRCPKSLEEAAAIVAAEGKSARLVAGGTDLWPNMKRRHQEAETVVSLMRIPGLAGVSNGNGSGELRIGGTTTLDTIERDPQVLERYPALARAVASISSPPLRNMGTIGGNVCVDTRCTYYNQTEEWRRSIDYCLKEEGTVCWVAPNSPKCWAHSASDSAPILSALKARVQLISTNGERTIPIESLFQNDGIEYLTKSRDEILTSILLPAESAAGTCRSAFWKLRRRGSIDFGVLSVGAAIWTDDAGTVEDARIWLGNVGSQPLFASRSSELLIGGRLEAEALAEAGRLARKVATPMDNTDFLTQWRGVMVERYVEAALREIAGLPQERFSPNHL
jgi:4-hydroxybenzoyl-CoA reductase subunit beta